MDIRQSLQLRLQRLQQLQAQDAVRLAQIKVKQEKLLSCAQKLEISKQALIFLEELSLARRKPFISRLETVITDAVQAVFGKDFKVILDYDTKHNRSSLEFLIVHDTEEGEVKRDMYGHGGAMADAVAVPLRLLVLIGSKQTDRVCFLDETYKHVPPEHIEAVVQFLNTIAEKLKIQIFWCSHHKGLDEYIERIYEFDSIRGKTVIKASGSLETKHG